MITFDKNKSTTHTFTVVNDPVMGGQSVSKFVVHKGFANWSGEVKIVPFLQAPGFCTLRSNDVEPSFPNVQGMTTLKIELQNRGGNKSLTNFQAQIETKGGKVGGKRGMYIVDFEVNQNQNVIEVDFSEFSLRWRGEPLPGGPSLIDQLNEITRIGLGTAGKAGPFSLDVLSMSATSKAKSSKISSLKSPKIPKSLNLWTFDGAKGTTFKSSVINDPVMGGLSKSTFVQNSGFATFDGTVEIVPKLQAAGFCNAKTNLMDGIHFNHFNDVSNFSHLVLTVRSSTPEYKGFKISFAADTWNPQFYSFKSNFSVPAGESWSEVVLTWDEFSNDWSAYTGDCDTKDPNSRGKQHHCCSKEHPEVCPTKTKLSKIQQLGLWAEGHAGKFHLEVKSIAAGNMNADGRLTVVTMGEFSGFGVSNVNKSIGTCVKEGERCSETETNMTCCDGLLCYEETVCISSTNDAMA